MSGQKTNVASATPIFRAIVTVAAIFILSSISVAQVLRPLPPTAQGAQSYGQSIDTDGTVVGYTSDGINDYPTIWHPDAIYSAEALPLPAGNTTGAANAINSAGVSVGYAQPADLSTASATVWTGTAGAYSASILPGPTGTALTNAYAINASGTAVGYSTDAGGTTGAAVWLPDSGGYSPGVMLPVIPGQIESGATAINPSGDIAGYVIKPPPPMTSEPVLEAAVWLHSGNSYVPKEVISVNSAEVTAMNDYGTGAGVYNGNEPLVMSYYEGDFYAFNLPFPYGSTDGASDTVNSSDGIAGYVKDADTPIAGPEAAIWLPTDTFWDYLNLNEWLKQTDPAVASHWTLNEITSLSDNWQVTGNGTFYPGGVGSATGVPRAFVMDVSSLVPEPSAAGLILAILVFFVCRRGIIDHNRSEGHVLASDEENVQALAGHGVSSRSGGFRSGVAAAL